jgi:hypothetical protein
VPGGADTNLDESLFADVPAGGEFSDSIGQRVPDLFRIASETAPTPLSFPEPAVVPQLGTKSFGLRPEVKEDRFVPHRTRCYSEIICPG